MRGLLWLADQIDRLNAVIGRAVSWLALFMVLVQFALVVMRYVFGLSSIQFQESLLYAHGAMLMLAAGYTLLRDGHVRVDIFYREASAKRRALVDLLGVLLLLIPFAAVLSISAWPYVADAWAVREGSRETSGIQAVFLLKSVILVFAALLTLQGVSLAIRAMAKLTGRSATLTERR